MQVWVNDGMASVGYSAVKPCGNPLTSEMVNATKAVGSKFEGLTMNLFKFNTNSASDISPTARTVVSLGTKMEAPPTNRNPLHRRMSW